MQRTASFTIPAATFVLCLQAMPAWTQSAQTFVSGVGNDSSPSCIRTSPCRTFASAITKTSAGGEITVLDGGSYGPLNINKSISITNDGAGEASIRPGAGADGITIGAAATDVIYLRGLIIDGGGIASHGIEFFQGKTLIVDNCVIRNFVGPTGDGIRFQPGASSNLAVSNTRVSNNGGSGIFVAPVGTGTVTATLSRIETNNNNTGVYLNGNTSTGVIRAVVADSVAANNTLSGFGTESMAGHAATSLTLVRSVAANNETGILAAGPNTLVRVARSTATGNAAGWSGWSGGVVLSYGDNYIDGNTAVGAPPTIIPTR